jgi:hypothetical protein
VSEEHHTMPIRPKSKTTMDMENAVIDDRADRPFTKHQQKQITQARDKVDGILDKLTAEPE